MNALEVDKQQKEQTRLQELKIRTKNCCCRYCGGALKLRRILYGNVKEGRVEIFCTDCDRIEYGIKREIYLAAKYFVDEFAFNIYPEQDDSVQTFQMNVAKVCDIMAWGFKKLDLLDYAGFKVPVDISGSMLGEEIIFRDGDLDYEVMIEDMDEDQIFGRKTGGQSCL